VRSQLVKELKTNCNCYIISFTLRLHSYTSKATNNLHFFFTHLSNFQFLKSFALVGIYGPVQTYPETQAASEVLSDGLSRCGNHRRTV